MMEPQDESKDEKANHGPSKVKSFDVTMTVAVAIAKTGFAKQQPQKTYFGLSLEETRNSEKISLKTAIDLKNVCWGSSTIPIKKFWFSQGLILHPPEQLFAYGIKAPENGTKNFLMCIQAYFLKNLLFDPKPKAKNRLPKSTEVRRKGRFSKLTLKDDKGNRKGCIKPYQVLRPNSQAQEDMIVGGLSEMLFKVSAGDEVVFCMIGREVCFEPNPNFGIDGFTEKIHIFRCKTRDELRDLIRRFLTDLRMENKPAILCLLYTLLLTRKLDRIKIDLQNEERNSLIDTGGDCSQPLLNLIIFGKATPYLHNGILSVKDEETGVVWDRAGVLERSEIGLLLWEKDDFTTALRNLGSKLKTPLLPLWVTNCNDSIGVLFSTNKELICTYNAEKRFKLYYYSDHEFKADQVKETKLMIETNVESKHFTKDFDDEESEEMPTLEQAIRTKWDGCSIDWSGVVPYV